MQTIYNVYYDDCNDRFNPSLIGKGVVSSKRVRADNETQARKKFMRKFPNYKILMVIR